MRRLAVWSSVACLLFAGFANAESEAVINVPEIEVRSGPSATFYPTGKLRQGDRVEIVKQEEGGWLAIKPPPGSFSWIKTCLIDRAGHSGVVLGSDVPVRIGSDLFQGEPTVQQVKLQRGTQILVLDTKQVYAQDGGWLAIVPPTQEVRYIPADAVQQAPQVQSSSSASPTATVIAPAAQSDDELWQLARQLESVGNNAEAEKTYTKLAQQSKNHDLTMRCYNQIHHLRQSGRGGAQGHMAGRPPQGTVTTWNRNQPTGQPVSQVPTQHPQGMIPYHRPGTPAPQPVVQNSGPGRLRKAAFYIDNQPAYVLENSQGLPLYYVTGQPGMNLEMYLNRVVDLQGPVVFRGDVRKNYMHVTHVNLIQ